MDSRIKQVFVKYKYSIFSLVVTFLLGTIIFFARNFMNNNSYMFMHSDMQSQMMPVLKLFFRQLLSGKSIFYSFSYGLGGSTIPIYTNGSCFSIFNIILLLPFDANIQAYLLVMSKLAFGAFFFSELCRVVYKKNSIINIALSCSYALCSFNIAYYFVIIWQDGIYMLPLIIIFIYKLIKNKKFPLLIVAYAYVFICNFYSGYLIGIFSFIFLLFFLFIDKNASKEKVRLFLNYVIYVVLAISISAVLLLPTAATLLSNDSSEASTFSSISLNIFDFIKQFFIGQYVLDGEKGLAPYVYCGIIPFVCVPIFFVEKKVDRTKKIIYGIILLLLSGFTFTKIGYMFIHAFNNPDNFGYRFAFLFSFTILLIYLELSNCIGEVSNKKVISVCIMYLLYIALYGLVLERFSRFNNGGGLFNIIVNTFFLLVYILVFYYKKKLKKHFLTIITLLFIFEVMINGIMLSNMIDVNITEQKEVYNYFYNEEENLVRTIGNDYTRISMPNSVSYNNSQIMGYRSTNAFSSFLDSNLRRTMRKIGYATSDLEIKDMGYTDVSNMLLGVDYSLFTNDFGLDHEAYYVENYSLPIAYMSSEKILDLSLSNNPFENLNSILSSITGDEVEYYYNTGSNVEIDTNNIIIDTGVFNDEDVVLYSIENPGNSFGYIKFFDMTGESVLCYFDMQDSYMYYNSPVVSEKLDGYRDAFDTSYISMPHIVRMGLSDNSTQSYVILDEQTNQEYYFNKAYFYGEHSEEFDEIYNNLSSNIMRVDALKDGYVSGEVESVGDKKVLFTTIPYDNNWSVYIDGKKEMTVGLLDDAFVGAKIPDGTHYIEFKYTDKWAGRGAILSLIGVILTICLFIGNKRKVVVG